MDFRGNLPTQILLGCCISLSLTLGVFLIAAEKGKVSSLGSCRVAAIALHYLVLTTFMWMAISAFNMYQAFMKVVPSRRSSVLPKYSLIGWGNVYVPCIPALAHYCYNEISKTNNLDN